MSELTSASSGPGLRPLVVGAVVLALLMAGTLGLWVHYGTAVFLQVIVSGLQSCF